MPDGLRKAPISRLMPGSMRHGPTIWVISDAKAGHESQSLGLASAVTELVGGSVRLIRLEARPSPLALRARAPEPDERGPPDLVIGAGSRTHATLRACARAYRARTIVLMRPAFGRYDLVVAPMHDRLREREGVVSTRGAITLVRPSPRKNDSRGLLLVGGPSKHHGWDDAQIALQVSEVVRATPEISWTLTTSRRTPASFLPALPESRNLEVFHVEHTTREWLLERYAQCARIWVTEDSVSMVYEALTSGARVGLLRVPRAGSGGRVVRGIDALARDGYARWFDDHEGDLPEPPEQLDEAARVARIAVDMLQLRRGAS